MSYSSDDNAGDDVDSNSNSSSSDNAAHVIIFIIVLLFSGIGITVNVLVLAAIRLNRRTLILPWLVFQFMVILGKALICVAAGIEILNNFV